MCWIWDGWMNGLMKKGLKIKWFGNVLVDGGRECHCGERRLNLFAPNSCFWGFINFLWLYHPRPAHGDTIPVQVWHLKDPLSFRTRWDHTSKLFRELPPWWKNTQVIFFCILRIYIFREVLRSQQNWEKSTDISLIHPASTFASLSHYQCHPPEWIFVIIDEPLCYHILITQSP